MNLTKHRNYLLVSEAAEWSHQNSRNLQKCSDRVVLLARLYCYGFRGQVIGAFHATRQALENWQRSEKPSKEIQQACDELGAMANLAVEFVPTDFRAILTTFYRYDQALTRVMDSLNRIMEQGRSDELFQIASHFVRAMQRVTGSSGIVLTRDDEVPPQASFIVPNLGITIVPLVYGDQHSWNLAFLSGKHLDVPRHLHKDGIEIHLGLGEVHGYTCLGGHRAEVTEGYAMPIPPGTPHGFINTASQDHVVPFIFGSRRLGGWGIFPDVEPQPAEMEKLSPVDLRSREMNGSVLLDREIEQAAKSNGTARRILVPPERTYLPHSGGLTLSLAHIGTGGLKYAADRFQIISVVRGRGTVTIGDVRQEITPHDHFGIPSGSEAFLEPAGQEPLVVLDVVLVEELNSPTK